MTMSEMELGGYIWMIIIWVVIIAGSVWLLGNLFPRLDESLDELSDSDGDSLAILKQRYARGELSKDEFDAIRRDLEQT